MKVDKPEGKEKEDPQESMMNMMKKLYQEGDDEMKKTIAQAWVFKLNFLWGARIFCRRSRRRKRIKRRLNKRNGFLRFESPNCEQIINNFIKKRKKAYLSRKMKETPSQEVL